MSTKKPRLWAPKPHKAVDWNQKAIEKALSKGPLWAVIKYDGFRCLITNLDGEVRITTREGIELTSLEQWRPVFADILVELAHDAVLDCEVYIPGIPFEEASGHFRREAPIPKDIAAKVQFCVFDCVPRSCVLADAPYSPTRRERLGHLHGIPFNPHNVVHRESHWVANTVPEVARLYTLVRRHGWEGLILKDPDLHYRNGKVTGWWKVKPGCGADFAPGFEADGVVVGYVWGDETKGNAGKIVGFRVKLEDGTEVNATGLTQEQMGQYTSNYHATAYEVGIAQTIYIGWHCRVSGMERTKDGSIRHPHFDGFRDVGGTKA